MEATQKPTQEPTPSEARSTYTNVNLKVQPEAMAARDQFDGIKHDIFFHAAALAFGKCSFEIRAASLGHAVMLCSR